MYGMVNLALQALITQEHGQATWERIKDKAGVEVAQFTSMAAYDDSITYGLAIAASEVLEAPVPHLLEVFGRFWIRFAMESPYAFLLGEAGSNLHELIPALDGLHTRLGLTFPELDPPSFGVVEETPQRIVLRYESHRPGLTPFVIGLVQGLADLVGQRAAVALLEAKGEKCPADIFEVRILEAA